MTPLCSPISMVSCVFMLSHQIVPKLSDNKKKTSKQRYTPWIMLSACNSLHQCLPSQSTEITFLNDDVTRRDWSDADCWFANSTCFDETVGCGAAAVPSQLLTTLLVD